VKRRFGPTSLFVLACMLTVAAVWLAGCGRGDDSAASAGNPPAGGQAAYPSGTASTPATPVVPGSPPTSMPIPGPGVTPTPGGPAIPGGPTGPVQAGTTAAPAAPAAPRTATVPFERALLKSAVTRLRLKVAGGTLDFLRFKYADWEGKVRVCEMPASEAKINRTPPEWIATFDIYRQETQTTGLKTQKKVKRLTDFPFVSPPPAEQPGTQRGPGFGPPTPGGMPVPGTPP